MKHLAKILTLLAALALAGCASSRGGKVIDLTNARSTPAAQTLSAGQPSAPTGNVADFTR